MIIPFICYIVTYTTNKQFKQVLFLFGTKTTPEQKLLLSKFNKVIIVFDGDEAGVINGKKLAQEMSAFTEVELIILQDGFDPDKLSKKDINELKQMIKIRW